MYELPAANVTSAGPTPRVSTMPRIGVFLGIWLVLLVGYGAYKLFHHSMQVEPTMPPVAEGIRFPPDWNEHVGSLSTSAFESEASLRRVEDEIRRTLALTDSFVEARHLHAALQNLEAAHQDVVRSRHDIEALEVLLKGEMSQ